MKHLTLIFVFVFGIVGFSEGLAQKLVTLSGRITSAHGQPVAQASLAVEGTAYGTYSDEKGGYRLELPEGTYTVVASFIGYESQKQTVRLAGHKRIDFVLKEEAVALNEVEVYAKSQSQKLREGTFAVSALDVKPFVSSLNKLNELVDGASGF